MLFKTNDKALSFEVAERTTLSGQKTKRGMNGGYMDRGLTDLDALLLAVRDPQTKAYLTEAVLAYRVGAYRLAIVGTWTAVAYDIIAKIRELASSEDDAQAREFVAEFDRNVESSNVSKLLSTERVLIETASAKFGFPSPIDAGFLKRLQGDRHLCAHPAFAKDNELFRPIPDAVRAHIVQSVEALLALPPMSGKAIIEAFLADVASNAFPRDRERAIGYVRERYLKRMRSAVKHNLASVLIKAIVLSNVPQVLGRDDSLYHSLEAIEQDEPQTFSAEIIPMAAGILDRADENALLNGLFLLRRFSGIKERLQRSTVDRVHAVATSESSDARIFGAFGASEEIDKALVDRFERLNPGEASSVLLTVPDARFVPAVLRGVENARGFRTGEARLANVMHLAAKLSPADFARVVAAVGENSQVSNASGSRQALLQLAMYAVDHGLHHQIDWAVLRRRTWWIDGYERLWEMLSAHGVYDAPPGMPPEEE